MELLSIHAWCPLSRLKRRSITHSTTGGFNPSRGRGGARSALCEASAFMPGEKPALAAKRPRARLPLAGADLSTTQRYVHAGGADSVAAITRISDN